MSEIQFHINGTTYGCEGWQASAVIVAVVVALVWVIVT